MVFWDFSNFFTINFYKNKKTRIIRGNFWKLWTIFTTEKSRLWRIGSSILGAQNSWSKSFLRCFHTLKFLRAFVLWSTKCSNDEKFTQVFCKKCLFLVASINWLGFFGRMLLENLIFLILISWFVRVVLNPKMLRSRKSEKIRKFLCIAIRRFAIIGHIMMNIWKWWNLAKFSIQSQNLCFQKWWIGCENLIWKRLLRLMFFGQTQRQQRIEYKNFIIATRKLFIQELKWRNSHPQAKNEIFISELGDVFRIKNSIFWLMPSIKMGKNWFSVQILIIFCIMN